MISFVECDNCCTTISSCSCSYNSKKSFQIRSKPIWWNEVIMNNESTYVSYDNIDCDVIFSKVEQVERNRQGSLLVIIMQLLVWKYIFNYLLIDCKLWNDYDSKNEWYQVINECWDVLKSFVCGDFLPTKSEPFKPSRGHTRGFS